MSRNYNAFLVRHWSLDTDRGDRIEVVHVRSGDRSLVTSLTQAANWMQTRTANEGGEQPAPAASGDTSPRAGQCETPSLLLL